MSKIPRDLTGKELIKALEKYNYSIIRQVGSHIRIESFFIKGKKHQVTVPDHNPIKIGTLNNILKDISNYLRVSKNEVVKNLFD